MESILEPVRIQFLDSEGNATLSNLRDDKLGEKRYPLYVCSNEYDPNTHTITKLSKDRIREILKIEDASSTKTDGPISPSRMKTTSDKVDAGAAKPSAKSGTSPSRQKATGQGKEATDAPASKKPVDSSSKDKSPSRRSREEVSAPLTGNKPREGKVPGGEDTIESKSGSSIRRKLVMDEEIDVNESVSTHAKIQDVNPKKRSKVVIDEDVDVSATETDSAGSDPNVKSLSPSKGTTDPRRTSEISSSDDSKTRDESTIVVNPEGRSPTRKPTRDSKALSPGKSPGKQRVAGEDREEKHESMQADETQLLGLSSKETARVEEPSETGTEDTRVDNMEGSSSVKTEQLENVNVVKTISQSRQENGNSSKFGSAKSGASKSLTNEEEEEAKARKREAIQNAMRKLAMAEGEAPAQKKEHLNSVGSDVILPSKDRVEPPKEVEEEAYLHVPRLQLSPRASSLSLPVKAEAPASSSSSTALHSNAPSSPRPLIRIGPAFQATIPPFLGPKPSRSAPTTHDELLYSPRPLVTGASTTPTKEPSATNVRVEIEAFYIVRETLKEKGSVVPVAVHHPDAMMESDRKRVMWSRIVEPLAEGGSTIRVIPVDALWPNEGEDVPAGLVPSLEVPKAAVFVPETILERCMLKEFRLRTTDRASGEFTVEEKKRTRGVDEMYESWTKKQYDEYCLALRNIKDRGFLRDAAKASGKTMGDVVEMFYIPRMACSNSVGGMVPCSNCRQTDKPVLSCTRYFECKTALCSGCYTSARFFSKSVDSDRESDAGKTFETVRYSHWFCKTCVRKTAKGGGEGGKKSSGGSVRPVSPPPPPSRNPIPPSVLSEIITGATTGVGKRPVRSTASYLATLSFPQTTLAPPLPGVLAPATAAMPSSSPASSSSVVIEPLTVPDILMEYDNGKCSAEEALNKIRDLMLAEASKAMRLKRPRASLTPSSSS